ncbi:hypothetical protein WJX81_003786 [Elliptochloris bilobata]|uniref:Beta-hexosaminidase n=1 Tax=Elliptochloris bilobata TaxID=381761 RepID=A0AAW1RRI8_9CHLO
MFLLAAALLLLPGFAQGGAVWPLPLTVATGEKVLHLDVERFHFKAIGYESELLSEAFKRYEELIFDTPSHLAEEALRGGAPANTSALAGALGRSRHTRIKRLRVYVGSYDQSLNLQTDESYTLSIASPTSTLQATTVFGALRGLETFSQLAGVEEGVDEEHGQQGLAKHKKHKHKRHEKKKHKKKKRRRRRSDSAFLVRVASIWDAPRFAHRGLLLDTGRHFLPVSALKDTLDAMAWAKLNVLHWHLVDDQSFPYASEALSRLAAAGAFSPAHTYSLDDVRGVVAYARARGIRIVPEFDTPGHTASWGRGYPDLLTDCYNESGARTGAGPLDPTRNGTYGALWRLLREAAGVFPDAYVHLGGDEVDLACWESNPAIKQWMAQHNMRNVRALLSMFEERVLSLAATAGRSYIVWQEVLDNGVRLRNDAVVHLRRVTGKGYRTLLSSPWYLNLGGFATPDWEAYYGVEPTAFGGSSEQQQLIIGGEACMWGEFVDATNLIQQTWPRANAVAERLWSGKDIRDVDAARPRYAEHRCRMLARGLGARPDTGPGFCPQD